LQCNKVAISIIKKNISEFLDTLDKDIVKEEFAKMVENFNKMYNNLNKLQTDKLTTDQCSQIYTLELNLKDFLKNPKYFKDDKSHFNSNNNKLTGGSRSKSKFSRKRQHRHLSGKNRKHTLKRLYKKQKTNKNRNGNNIRKKTLKRN